MIKVFYCYKYLSVSMTLVNQPCLPVYSFLAFVEHHQYKGSLNRFVWHKDLELSSLVLNSINYSNLLSTAVRLQILYALNTKAERKEGRVFLPRETIKIKCSGNLIHFCTISSKSAYCFLLHKVVFPLKNTNHNSC